MFPGWCTISSLEASNPEAPAVNLFELRFLEPLCGRPLEDQGAYPPKRAFCRDPRLAAAAVESQTWT